MPLVTLDGSYGLKSEGRQPILVFADGDRNMGLLVDQIVDIVEDHLNVEITTERPGFLGSAVIAGKATEIIDVGKFLHQGFSDWFGRNVAFGETETGKRLLLVDDSPFFRNMLKPLLQVAGYQVTTVESADAALQLRESGEAFDVIISDIEMPGMSGFEFASVVRQQGSWKSTPLVALSSHATPSDFERGREAGFSDYVQKLDRDALLTTLVNTLERSREAA
jgi:two-component system chemotaxis sensor kinase CheA